LAIIAACGPHAYFREGLHVSDWKHDLLSNGAYLSFTAKLVPMPQLLCPGAAATMAADFCSMIIEQIIWRKRRATGMAFRPVGGAALRVFAWHLYRQGSWGLHQVPWSALMGGAVLMWKGFASILRGIRRNRELAGRCLAGWPSCPRPHLHLTNHLFCGAVARDSERGFGKGRGRRR
jgi:hypothetical protein